MQHIEPPTAVKPVIKVSAQQASTVSGVDRRPVYKRAVGLLPNAIAPLLLMLASGQADAAVRRLSECDAFSGSPSQSQPFDLDACPIQNGDDITQLLTDIVNRWPGGFYVRAPSKDLTVVSNTIAFPSSTKVYYFVEDGDPANRMTIKHLDSAADPYEMWQFVNFQTVVIGGRNRSMSFYGTHRGLATFDLREQHGLLQFLLNDGTSAPLVDVRANFWKTHSYGVNFVGGSNGSNGEATANRVQQVNIAGRFVGSGVYVLGGVHRIWYDPNNTVIEDPWVRANGWDGGTAGCRDESKAMVRQNPRVNGNYIYKVTGGVTLKYGTPSASAFVVKYMGNSVDDPFVVNVQDWGFSGPTAITGLPEGVRVKSVYGGVMKNDPAFDYGLRSPFRFVKFVQLPGAYGKPGGQYAPITAACAAGNSTDNNYHGSVPWFWQAEASRDGLSSQYTSTYFDVSFEGFTDWNVPSGVNFIKAAGDGADGTAPNPDRSYGHTLRAKAGSTVPSVATLNELNTVTGPGYWDELNAIAVTTSAGYRINAHDIKLVNTNVRGKFSVASGSTAISVDNVNFKGDAAREILSVASGVTVSMSNICVRAGSTIGGSGRVDYEGTIWALPMTFARSLDECSLSSTAAAVPLPPEQLSVE